MSSGQAAKIASQVGEKKSFPKLSGILGSEERKISMLALPFRRPLVNFHKKWILNDIIELK